MLYGDPNGYAMRDADNARPERERSRTWIACTRHTDTYLHITTVRTGRDTFVALTCTQCDETVAEREVSE